MVSKRLIFATVALLCSIALAQTTPQPCASCAVWNVPQVPFRIYGNSYYVGTHGLSSILITSDAGHVLIDGGLAESAPQIAANIRTLGFRITDVKLILNSHVHYDHAGGIAELQYLSGARVAASPWSADVLSKTGVGRGDPQFGVLRPISLIKDVEAFHDGEDLHLGPLVVTAHLTPGHTPGGTSWTWNSCQGGKCLNLVYADSLTPVSADGFKFTASHDYPTAIQDFHHSFDFLKSTPCDILVTTHPDISDLWDRLKRRQEGVKLDPMVDAAACRALADRAEEALQRRIAAETAK